MVIGWLEVASGIIDTVSFSGNDLIEHCQNQQDIILALVEDRCATVQPNQEIITRHLFFLNLSTSRPMLQLLCEVIIPKSGQTTQQSDIRSYQITLCHCGFKELAHHEEKETCTTLFGSQRYFTHADTYSMALAWGVMGK